LVVVVPRCHGIRDVPGLLESKQRWILKNIARYNADLAPFDSNSLNNGDLVPYLGQDHKVHINGGHSNKCSVRLENNELFIEGQCDKGIATATLKQWLRSRATAYLQQRTSRMSADLGFRYNRIYIRGQRTLWGSCSGKGNISLNWKLIMFPPYIIDYVIIHELAHLKVMNHSKAFWNIVAALCPQWRTHRKWLKHHEGYLGISA
jgi:predicted metal-dependent hydrolase